MSKLNDNTAALQALLEQVNALPDAGEGGGGDVDSAIIPLIDGTITSITTNASKVEQYRLSKCTRLTEVSLPEARYILGYGLNGCSGLTKLYAPKVKSLALYSLGGCSSLKEAVFPAVTSAGSYTFQNCTSLEKVDFHILESFSANVFNGCSNLTALIIRSTEDVASLSNTNAFTKTPIADGTGYVYVPRAMMGDYADETNWSGYNFRAIEDYPDICGG